MASMDPNNENYVTPEMEKKKRREIQNGSLPSISNGNFWNTNLNNPVIKKSNDDNNNSNSWNIKRIDNPFIKNWNYENADNNNNNSNNNNGNNNGNSFSSFNNNNVNNNWGMNTNSNGNGNGHQFSWNNNNGNTSNGNQNQSSLQFQPRQVNSNKTNATTEDLGNMGFSKSTQQQFNQNL